MGKHDSIVSIIEKIAEKYTRKINFGTRFSEDLGFDSLNMMHVIVAIEDEFDIDISIPRLVPVSTVGDLCDLVDELCGGGQRDRVA